MDFRKEQNMNFLGKLKLKREKSNIIFEDIINEWMKNKKSKVKKSTYSNYQYMINKHLRSYLSKKKLNELEKYDFNEFVEILNQKLGPKTVRDIICILKSILYYAEDKYYCKFKINKIILPKLATDTITVFDKKEKQKIEDYCIKKNTNKELGILICLYTGLRIGELCALRWENIDLGKRIIYVKHTLERIYNDEMKCTKIIIDKPKSKTSVRAIPISNKLYEILKSTKTTHHNSDFFLSSDSEKYIEPRNYENTYKIILKKCKIEPHKFHCLRHTFATDCIEVRNGCKIIKRNIRTFKCKYYNEYICTFFI
jgi:integrase